MKLKLSVEELRVETFATTRGSEQERGTVRAHELTQPPNCVSGEWTCIPEASCVETCGMSCWGSCVDTYECCM